MPLTNLSGKGQKQMPSNLGIINTWIRDKLDRGCPNGTNTPRGDNFSRYQNLHCDLDLWPFDLKIYRAHPCLMGSLHVKFHDDRCKGKAVMRRKPFSVIYALWPWPFDLKIYRAHPCLMGSLHVKFHDGRCKGKAVMRRKPFSVIYALWPWPLTFWPQNL